MITEARIIIMAVKEIRLILCFKILEVFQIKLDVLISQLISDLRNHITF